MSVEVLTTVWKFAPYSGNTLLTLLALADWSNDEGQSWPSVETLAKKSRQSERNCRYSIRKLETDGYVSVLKRADDSSLYRINLEKLTGAKISPLRGKTKQVGGQNEAENVSQIAPYTSLEPSVSTTFNLSPPSSEDVKKPSDPRYTEFIEIISKGYKQKKWPFAWTARDGAQLKALLKAYPALDAEKFRFWMKNYFRSEGVVKGDVPYAYLTKLPRYWAGPLNEFSKPMTKTDTAATVEEVNRIYAD